MVRETARARRSPGRRNTLGPGGVLLLVSSTNYLAVFSEPQRDGLAMLFLRLHHFGIQSSLLFAGLWLVPFGILVFKSGFLPRILGVWLVVDCFAWLAICIDSFLAPQYGDIVDKITSPIILAEMTIMLWLLIVGARKLGPFRIGRSSR